jgi:hypothetical protein
MMDERDIEQEGQNRKRKGWRIEKKIVDLFHFLSDLVCKNIW